MLRGVTLVLSLVVAQIMFILKEHVPHAPKSQTESAWTGTSLNVQEPNGPGAKLEEEQCQLLCARSTT